MPKAKAQKPKPEKPWRRVSPGSYRSADDRFEIEQADGRWFVRDESALDELGLPRTLGPFATLEAARDEADRTRSAPAAVSPLAGRIHEAAAAGPAAKPRPRKRAAPAARTGSQPAPPTTHTPPPRPAPTWLDGLDQRDAARARQRIGLLERLGFADAERLVQTDMTTAVPAVARALLARRVVRAALTPGAGDTSPFGGAPDAVARAVARARAAGLDERDLSEIAGWAARRAAVETLEQVANLERDPDAPRGGLPGWVLLERPAAEPADGGGDREPAGRRIRLGAADLSERGARADG